jgi:hypothetical protein
VDDVVAELALLRRRAYGPDADIDADPAAVARLDELETRVRLDIAARTAPPPSEPPLAFAIGVDVAQIGTAPDTAAAVAPERSRRYGGRIAVACAVAAVAVVMGVQAANGPTVQQTEPSTLSAPEAAAARVSGSSETRLIDIPLDRSLARYVEQPPAPTFPVDDGLSWAESLGPYYGWTVWLARSASGDQRCILLGAAEKIYSECQHDEGFLAGMLEVSVPYGDIAAEVRPARMTGGQSLVFRWTAERGVSIALDEADITYFGDDD